MAKIIVKEEIISKLKNIIKSNNGIINPNEAISKTGYAKDDIITALNRLIELFEARVMLDDIAGGLKFIFKYPLRKRGKKSVKEILAAVSRTALKVFKTIYKAAVGVILITYTVIFAIILLAAMGSNDNKRDGGGANIVGFLFRAIGDAIFWSNMTRPYYITEDRYGNKYKTFPQKENSKGTGFIKGVFAFVFGPEIPPVEEEADVSEVASYIRLRTNGIITAANMIELAGIDYDKAESRLAEYCGKFDGFLDINNDGVVYGNFSNIMGTTSSAEHKNIVYYIDEIEPPIEFTGNKIGRNIGIICMNAFNLIMSIIILHMHNNPPVEYLSGETNNFILWKLIYGGFGFWLGWFPMLVSISYFVIPILRIPSYLIKKKNRNNRVLHKILVGSICSARKKTFTLYELIEMTQKRMNIATTKIQPMMNRIVVELKGSMEVQNDGTITYIFERLYDEFNLK